MPKGTGLNLDESQVSDSGAPRYAERFSIKRNAVSVTCTVGVDGEDDDVFQGVLEDISSSGLRMSSRYPVERGAFIEFAFDIKGVTQVREGEIMWVRVMGGQYKAGARFIGEINAQKEIELSEGINFPCEYKLNTSHLAKAQVIEITNAGIVFISEEILSLGTMLEVLIDPWLQKEKGVFNINFIDVFKLTDEWKLWDLHKVVKVSKAKQVGPGECRIEAAFVADKKRN